MSDSACPRQWRLFCCGDEKTMRLPPVVDDDELTFDTKTLAPRRPARASRQTTSPRVAVQPNEPHANDDAREDVNGAPLTAAEVALPMVWGSQL